MTTFSFQTIGPDRAYADETEEAFAAWREASDAVGAFATLDHLVSHLRRAASRRRPDPALTAMARIAEADRSSEAASRVYLDSFEEWIERLVGALCRRLLGPMQPAEALEVAERALAEVTNEASFLGEAQSGAAIRSRTWARAFLHAQRGQQPHRVLAELEALVSRGLEWLAAFSESLRGRTVTDRLVGRLVRTKDAAEVARLAGFPSEDFDALCLSRGIPPRLGNRQLRAYRERLPVHEREVAELTFLLERVGELLLFAGVEEPAIEVGETDGAEAR
jgi:hypothetical protein